MLRRTSKQCAGLPPSNAVTRQSVTLSPDCIIVNDDTPSVDDDRLLDKNGRPSDEGDRPSDEDYGREPRRIAARATSEPSTPCRRLYQAIVRQETCHEPPPAVTLDLRSYSHQLQRSLDRIAQEAGSKSD